jgi:hypothetical protein
MAQLAVRSWQPRRSRTGSGARSSALWAVRLGLTTAFAIAGLMFAFSSAAGAAVTPPLVSTVATVSGGTVLNVTFNEAPTLAGAYSLTLTDGTHVATLSSAAGTLSAAVSGSSIAFTVNGASTVPLSSLVEILGSTGVSDGSGNPWDLAASGQVDKAYILTSGDKVVVTYSEPVNVASPYSLTLQEGSGSAVINQGDSSVSGNGTSTITYNVTGNPSGTVAADGPLVSSFSGVTAVPTLQSGDTLTAVATGATGTITPPFGLTLKDASGDVGTLASGTNVTAGTPVLGTPAGDTTFTYTLTGAPTMTTGTGLSTAGLTATAATGLGGGAATPFVSLGVTGPPPPSPTFVSDSVNIDIANTCSSAGVTRVFNGSNCSIGFSHSGPVTPDVYDVIPLPTQDLPGPPNDAAPEVITSCGVGSNDVVYDLNTGAELGSNLCGNNPPGEASIGNTNSNTLDYIPTPNLVSFEEVGVVETIPGSTYVSGTAVPPQISAIAVNANTATFSYYGNVVCQANSSDAPTIASYTYVTPYTKTTLAPGDLVYPTGISCPSSGGATTVTVTYQNAIPFSSGVRFKFVGYGAGHYMMGAPGSSFANEREASESAYAGPTATVDSFTPQSSTLPTSSGGTVNIGFATTEALTCSIGAVSLPAGAAALSLPSVASCNGSGTITVPANTSTTTNAVYTVTLTALGVAGTPAANAEITITVPAATPPPIVITSPPVVVVTPPPAAGKAHIAAPKTRLVFEQISSRKRTAKFKFKATGESTGFRCALVLLPTRKHAKTPSPKYVACGSSKTFKHLKIGKYVLYVRAIGPGGTRSPIVYRFKIV